jgi:tetratricopeptide (TPR) repeat protein
MRRLCLAGSLGAFLSACANPINDATWSRYTRDGNAAYAQGNLAAAEEAHRRALINVRLGRLGSEREATSLHNIGLVKRELCKLDEALEALSKAYELRDKNPATPPQLLSGTVFELAQLHYDQRRFPEALALMERGLPIIEKAGAEQGAPAAFAQVLLQYAEALRNLNRSADAQVVQARLDSLVAARGIDVKRKPNMAPFNHPTCGQAAKP